MLTDNEIFLLQLHKLSSELIEGNDLRKSLRRVLETARKLLHFSRVYLYIENPDKDLIEVLMAVGKYSFIAKSLKWPRDSMGAPTYVFTKGKSVIQHGLKDKRFLKYYPKKLEDREVLFSIYTLGKFGDGDILLVPVFFRGRNIAVLGADKLGAPITKNDLIHLEEFASQIGWAIENARLREENAAVMKNLEAMVDRRTKELKELQAQLIHSERLAAMGELVAGLTHELKNPLGGIQGFTELLKEYIPEKGEARQIMNGLITSVNHMQAVIKNFLSFVRNNKPERKAIDINKTIVDALALTSYNIRRRNIQVETNLSANLPKIKGDQNQLIQVFTNMFMNAEQAMPDGGKLTINSTSKDGKVIVTISDTGVGIPKENLENIFKPFFTTKGSGKGTGLGLSVSANIVKEHHGQIKVESELNKGTTFTLSFPKI